MNIFLHDEVETRFPVESFGLIKQGLKALGAVRAWRGIEEIRYFDTPSRIFKERGERIRIKRRRGGIIEAQYKRFLPDIEHAGHKYKVRSESESIACASIKEAKKVVRELWHPDIEEVKEWRYRKQRQHWLIGDKIAIELDTLLDLGDKRYVEIEGPTSDINRIVEVLELDWSSATTEGYRAEHVREEMAA